MSDALYCVYCHISPHGKKYVGITSTNPPTKRWGHNGYGYIKNTHFYRAIQKYGWNNFEHLILKENLSAEEAAALERKLILEWNLLDSNYGYNLSGGGEGALSELTRQRMSEAQKGNQNSKGVHPSEDTKQKISSSLKRYYSNHPNPMLGRKLTEEQIAKLKNRLVTEETRKKMRENHADVSGSKNPSAKAVCCFSKDGDFIEYFSTASEGAKKYQVDLSSIIKCCRGKNKTCGGFIWKYSNDMEVL